MPSIFYEEVDLSDERLKALETERDSAPQERRYGAFKRWLHWANLKCWRQQGLHFRYLTMGSTSERGPKFYCTCGLAVDTDGVGAEVVVTPEGVDFDEVQVCKGHRRLPSGEGLATAMIVNFSHVYGMKGYRWDCFCQGCGRFEKGLSEASARSFVERHDRECGGDGR